MFCPFIKKYAFLQLIFGSFNVSSVDDGKSDKLVLNCLQVMSTYKTIIAAVHLSVTAYTDQERVNEFSRPAFFLTIDKNRECAKLNTKTFTYLCRENRRSRPGSGVYLTHAPSVSRLFRRAPCFRAKLQRRLTASGSTRL